MPSQTTLHIDDSTACIRCLNMGCGSHRMSGWLNADLHGGPGVDVVGNVRMGLHLETDSTHYIVAMHMLQDLPYQDIPIALQELKRVLIPNGVLSLGLPDLDKAIHAYLSGNHGYFHVPDFDAEAIGTKLITQIIWYGSVRTPFTFDCVAELLLREGFRHIRRCEFGQTDSLYQEIVSLEKACT